MKYIGPYIFLDPFHYKYYTEQGQTECEYLLNPTGEMKKGFHPDSNA